MRLNCINFTPATRHTFLFIEIFPVDCTNTHMIKFICNQILKFWSISSFICCICYYNLQIKNTHTHTRTRTRTHTHTRLTALCPGLPRWAGTSPYCDPTNSVKALKAIYNIVLRTLSSLKHNSFVAIAAKYGTNSHNVSFKNAVWQTFSSAVLAKC